MNDQKNNTDSRVAISRRAMGIETPIIINELTERCLYVGLFGTLDSARMKKVIDAVLDVANRNDNDIMVVDLSNVEIIDSAIANHLKKLNKLLLFIGMEVIFCGIRPIVAQSMISAGVDLEDITIEKNLKRALKLVFSKQGLELVKK